MGSLKDIYKELKSVVKGDLAIINNISTQLALDVANKIINKEEIESIVIEASKNNKTEYKYYKSENRKKAIIVSCISGIGTAEKLKEIMTKCVGDADIEVITQDYNSIKYQDNENKIFKQYDVKLIIATAGIDRDDVPVIEMQNLINNEGEEKIQSTLEAYKEGMIMRPFGDGYGAEKNATRAANTIDEQKVKNKCYTAKKINFKSSPYF